MDSRIGGSLPEFEESCSYTLFLSRTMLLRRAFGKGFTGGRLILRLRVGLPSRECGEIDDRLDGDGEGLR